MQHDFPVLEVDKVYHKSDAIWPFTVVGRPPQEDSSFGDLIHDLTDTSEAFVMKYQGASNITLYGTGQSVTSMTFIRLGDT